ncbi:hypothetical protein ACFO5O_01435 [Geojedonia litorea]|uniref:Uncharacterized protein n=1 Tax=Geojedonia litorea TaxID=1268269 RepID=A0ABV9N1W1_9FLAO
MKIKLKKIALIVEILGGIAILISLIFVGIQLKDNTKATRSSTATATIGTMTDWYVTMGTNAETSASFWRFLSDPDSMTKDQQLQHIYNLHGLLLTFQNSYYLALEGTLDERIPESLNQVIAGVKDQPGFLLYWNARKSIFFKEYRDYVDEILNSTENISKGIYKENSE